MIQIDSISIVYDQHIVQENISLQVARGEKVALYGASGSGKSSVLESILGFVVPQKGTIKIDGTELTAESVWPLRRLIGYIAQEPDLGEGTARQVAECPFSFRANHDLAKNLTRLEEMFGQFALDRSLLSKETSELSGGEKQRLGLIIALLLDRPILLGDEISSALDPGCKRLVADHISQCDQTVILVTHDPVMQEVCDRVVSLDDLKGRTP